MVARAHPRVSVVVPCYNYGHYLDGAVESALGQPGADVDVIIVDDASTDGSAAVAADIAARDPRVTVIAHPTNAGHIATYNDGLAAATGDYVVLLSADDLLAPGALQRATALMEAQPSVGLTYGRVSTFSVEAPPPVASHWSGHSKVWKGGDWLRVRAVRGRNCIFCPEVVMRTTTYRKVGPYRADLPHSADFAMWLAAAGIADVAYLRGVDQAYYRVHASNMHATVFNTDKRSGFIVDLEHRRRAFEASFAEVDNGPSLYRQACVALAKEAVRHACTSYDEGSTAADPPIGYQDFARAADPTIVKTAAWAALQRRERMGADKAAARPLRHVRRAFDDVASRVRWRQWRRTGL